MNVISVRRDPAWLERVRDYVKAQWASADSAAVYDDCFAHCLNASGPLPQWYGLEHDGKLIGCAGLITNDFISRMDLWPWLCALYIAPAHRGRGYAGALIDQAERDAAQAGFSGLYLRTDHVGYYERYGSSFLGMGHHPWGEQSRVYAKLLTPAGPEAEP